MCAVGYKAVLAAVFVMYAASCARAENDTIPGVERLVRDVDKVLDKRDERGRARTDTLFLKRAAERLRLKLTVNASGSDIVCRGRTDNGSFKTTLEAQNKYTLSLSASYRGLSLGVAVNPAHLAGRGKDYEFNMNAYGNRVGADIIFHSANTFKGVTKTESGRTEIPAGLVRQNMLYLNTYYVLNSRRFSYPAAFSQSWMQLKSSGSLMLGLSFMGGNIKVRQSEEIGNDATRLSMADIGIGVGYGYNWVVSGKWLLHLSTLPQIVVLSRCRTTVNGERERSPYRFPNIIAVGRMAIVRHFDRYVTGLTTVVNTSSVGDNDRLRLNTVKWRARVFFGVKL